MVESFSMASASGAGKSEEQSALIRRLLDGSPFDASVLDELNSKQRKRLVDIGKFEMDSEEEKRRKAWHFVCKVLGKSYEEPHMREEEQVEQPSLPSSQEGALGRLPIRTMHA